MHYKTHMCMDVRGALRNWKDSEWRGVMTDDDGKSLSPREAQDFLFDELARGHVVIPLGPVCEGFDYSGHGCPSHEIDESTDEKGPK